MFQHDFTWPQALIIAAAGFLAVYFGGGYLVRKFTKSRDVQK